MDNRENLGHRLRSWLRKQGVSNLYLFSLQHNGNAWEIDYWGCDNIPQPEVSADPILTYEELFQEIEDESVVYFTADIYVVNADGNVTADRRQSLSRLEGNEIVLNMGRYYIHPDPVLELRLNGNVTNPVVKVIRDGVRLSVSSPSKGQATLVIWKI